MITLPMTTEQIQELFTAQEKTRLEIDIVNSKLKGSVLCTYIANMQLCCTFPNAKDLPYEEKSEILKNFIEFKYVIDCDTLLHTTASLMFFKRGLNTDIETFFSKEEAEKFISENEDTVNQICNFIDSFLLTVPSFEKGFRLKVIEEIEKGNIEEVTDPNAVGVNSLQLISFGNFLDLFLMTTNPKDVKYYTYAIGKLTFKQKTIYDLMVAQGGNSLLFSFINLFSSEEEKAEEVIGKITEYSREGV